MSRYLRKVKPAASGRVVATGPGPAIERVQFDYASWYTRIAAPGSRSRIGLALSAPNPIVHLDPTANLVTSAGGDRRVA